MVRSEEQEEEGSGVVEADIEEHVEVGSGRERQDEGEHFGESTAGVQGLVGGELEVCDKEPVGDVGWERHGEVLGHGVRLRG